MSRGHQGEGRGLGAAIKAQGVCRSVLPGVCTCSPFEEGILHSWIGGLGVVDGWGGCPPIGLGVKKADSKNCKRWTANSATTDSRQRSFLLRESGILVVPLKQVLLLRLGVRPMWALACSTQSLSQDGGLCRVLTTTNVGNVTQGQGVPDHQALSISGSQHAWAFGQMQFSTTPRVHCLCSAQWVFLLPRQF